MRNYIATTLLCLNLIACTGSKVTDSIKLHRRDGIVQINRFKPQKSISQKNQSVQQKAQGLNAYSKLDDPLRFKVSSSLNKKQKQENWEVPKQSVSQEESLFSLKPKDTDSTIKIQLKQK